MCYNLNNNCLCVQYCKKGLENCKKGFTVLCTKEYSSFWSDEYAKNQTFIGRPDTSTVNRVFESGITLWGVFSSPPNEGFTKHKTKRTSENENKPKSPSVIDQKS